MLAYHNQPAIKDKLLANLTEHARLDQIVQGHYWERGKGCAVACTLTGFDMEDAKTGNHASYETHFGIPEALARLEDRIFEGLTNGKAKEWPIRFATAIQPGADLSMVVPRLMLWLLSERLPQHVNKEKFPKAWAAIADVAELYCEWVESGKKPSRERFVEARAKAQSAAAYAAADADAADADADAAAYAAYAAADAAAYAAAADAAAADAAYAAARIRASLAWKDARSAEFEKIADKLIDLLAAAPVRSPEQEAA